MRIHTNLTPSAMMDVIDATGAPIQYREAPTARRSASHDYAYDIRLTGTGGRNNTGRYGAGDYDGATWDEWGAFFGALFEADPGARAGGTAARPVYGNADHYHFLTGARFRRRFKAGHTTLPTHLPQNTHPRHRWVYQGDTATGSYRVHECAKCGAVQRSIEFADFLATVAV
jgi:hypothetical protein